MGFNLGGFTEIKKSVHRSSSIDGIIKPVTNGISNGVGQVVKGIVGGVGHAVKGIFDGFSSMFGGGSNNLSSKMSRGLSSNLKDLNSDISGGLKNGLNVMKPSTIAASAEATLIPKGSVQEQIRQATADAKIERDNAILSNTPDLIAEKSSKYEEAKSFDSDSLAAEIAAHPEQFKIGDGAMKVASRMNKNINDALNVNQDNLNKALDHKINAITNGVDSDSLAAEIAAHPEQFKIGNGPASLLSTEQKIALADAPSLPKFDADMAKFNMGNIAKQKLNKLKQAVSAAASQGPGGGSSAANNSGISNATDKFNKITKKPTFAAASQQEIKNKKIKKPYETSFLHWDAPNMENSLGKMENLIEYHLQPKMKFSYVGEFPGKLQTLDWMIKTMDKPKVDIESIEQIRNNVKRNYPIKYNYGDLSITFWDDMQHKTVSTLYTYFTGLIWDHPVVSGRGTFMLRDSILIPEFDIFELTTVDSLHIKYSFENAVLASFDFDNVDDETDDGIHTIQAVFKIERIGLTIGSSPSFLTPVNTPIWK